MNCTFFDKKNCKCQYNEEMKIACEHQSEPYRYSDNVFFMPYVGANYKDGLFNGKRTLILGNSFYCGFETLTSDYSACRDNRRCMRVKSPECCYYASEILDLEYYDTSRTIRSLMRILSGRNSSDEDLVEQTQIYRKKIAFYNFVQYSLDNGSSKPTKEQCVKSDKAFFEVLDKIRPEAIIALGTSHMFSSDMPGEPGRFEEKWIYNAPITIEGIQINNGKYLLSDGTNVPCIWIPHPSRNSLPILWHNIIEQWENKI